MGFRGNNLQTHFFAVKIFGEAELVRASFRMDGGSQLGITGQNCINLIRKICKNASENGSSIHFLAAKPISWHGEAKFSFYCLLFGFAVRPDAGLLPLSELFQSS